MKKEFKDMNEREIGRHKTHCCRLHGCKYGDENCPVFRGYVKQEFNCEYCLTDTSIEEQISINNLKTMIRLNENDNTTFSIKTKTLRKLLFEEYSIYNSNGEDIKVKNLSDIISKCSLTDNQKKILEKINYDCKDLDKESEQDLLSGFITYLTKHKDNIISGEDKVFHIEKDSMYYEEINLLVDLLKLSLQNM